MNNNEYYTNSKGEKIKYSDMNTEHILNSITKKSRELFECKTLSDIQMKNKEINLLKEEFNKRIDKYVKEIGKR